MKTCKTSSKKSPVHAEDNRLVLNFGKELLSIFFKEP